MEMFPEDLGENRERSGEKLSVGHGDGTLLYRNSFELLLVSSVDFEHLMVSHIARNNLFE